MPLGWTVGIPLQTAGATKAEPMYTEQSTKRTGAPLPSPVVSEADISTAYGFGGFGVILIVTAAILNAAGTLTTSAQALFLLAGLACCLIGLWFWRRRTSHRPLMRLTSTGFDLKRPKWGPDAAPMVINWDQIALISDLQVSRMPHHFGVQLYQAAAKDKIARPDSLRLTDAAPKLLPTVWVPMSLLGYDLDTIIDHWNRARKAQGKHLMCRTRLSTMRDETLWRPSDKLDEKTEKYAFGLGKA